MSGGSGTRLWPLSTPEKPKQFHALATAHTMIQETVLRLSGDAFLKPVLICGTRHEALVREQFEAINLSPQAIILEPFARNTAAVAAIAALIGQEIDPEAYILLMPADHIITQPDAFHAAIERATKVAQDYIVTFGINPFMPETGFGYIQRQDAITDGVFKVAQFLEKPDLITAQAYVSSGEYDWNAGIFLFSPKVMMEELSIYEPSVLNGAREALEKATINGPVRALHEGSFAQCPSISVDYAIMERTKRAAVVPCDIGWADVGGYNELWRLGQKDENGNYCVGDTIAIDAQNNLIHAGTTPIAVIGLNDVIVVSTPAGIVVTTKDRAQDVKLAAEAIKKMQH